MFLSTKMKRKSLMLRFLNFLIKAWITIAVVREKENPAPLLQFSKQLVWPLKPAAVLMENYILWLIKTSHRKVALEAFS